ncbi:tRNA 2-thiouridine(34) synthase MnmA [Kyrpidia spormannii]|uniref:tRNA-specific 2-thiouridylase MnmA n=1 Tax=Kyrpidia spormannii TaxID=2055160 RepID=A0A2K8NB47_9BACL|nr:tRNA 2-thiouridine(34) synthase MnmA [Kyrpidia spormannii]ATY86556.1 tRNA 2-thiouridine(34) synthase MnmA [Kyrpidia spormannii]
MDKGTVVVAMSGGVDSSVTAALLKERGYDVIGITMRLRGGEETSSGRGCCSVDDVSDARRVCQTLGIPFYAVNYREAFEKRVIQYFEDEYKRGRTPNPCIACNMYMKYDLLLEQALDLGADYLATGHYARVLYDESRGRYVLRKAEDRRKDQTYVLYHLTQEQLARTLFPLGEYEKSEVREMAREFGLRVANKAESQDICFVPNGDYGEFLRRRMGDSAVAPGDFVDTEGHVVGRHEGVPFYTIGQRKGLGVAVGHPVYVVDIQPERNRVVLGPRERVFAAGLVASKVNWVSLPRPDGPTRVNAKIRYGAPEAAATLYPEEEGRVRVEFDEPQRAVTPGQAVVFYRGEDVVGGGTIEKSLALA